MRTYSTDGFDIRITKGLLEMRNEGTRTAALVSADIRALECLMRSGPVTAILFDFRAAVLAYDPVEAESCIRHVARLCRGLPQAVIARTDQARAVEAMLKTLKSMDVACGGFRSRREAHAWLRQHRQAA